MVARKLKSRIATALVAQCTLFVMSCADSVAVPSDAMMLEEFRSHRTGFERLRQMVIEDASRWAYFSESSISEVTPGSRRDEYAKLLKLWPSLTVGTNYGGTVRFIFASNERVAIAPGWTKGIEFVPEGKRMIGTRIDRLDECAKLPENVFWHEIEPQWYIFCQRDE
jgi:hypothetical protein